MLGVHKKVLNKAKKQTNVNMPATPAAPRTRVPAARDGLRATSRPLDLTSLSPLTQFESVA